MTQLLAWWQAVSALDSFDDGSLVIEDDTLSVNGGSNVNLRVKLGARPRSDVTVALAGPGRRGPTPTEQTIDLTASAYNVQSTGAKEWRFAEGSRPQFIPALTPSNNTNRYLGYIQFQADGRIILGIASATSFPGNHDLSDTFERDAILTITAAGQTLVIDFAENPQVTAPYSLIPVNSDEVIAFYNNLPGVSGGQVGSLHVADHGDAPPILSVSPASLVFTPDNWDTFKTAVVSAADTNSLVINLLASWYGDSTTTAGWFPPDLTLPQITGGLLRRPSDLRFFDDFQVRLTGEFGLNFRVRTGGGFSQNVGLSTAFEAAGSIQIAFAGNDYTFAMDGADFIEPYNITPADSADVIAAYNALRAGAQAIPGTLTLRDYVPGDATVSLSASGPGEYAGVTGSATVAVN